MGNSISQYSAAVGFLLPLLIAAIRREKWPTYLKTFLAILACAVAAVVTSYAEGKLNVRDWGQSVIVIFMLAKTSYMTVWKPTGVTDTIGGATG